MTKDKSITRGESELSGWNLKELQISDVHIPHERLKQVKTAASSAGVLRKFNISHDSAGLLYVKSGSDNGSVYSVLEPLTEKICYQIGRLLGFDVVRYELWSVSSSLFSDIELHPCVDAASISDITSPSVDEPSRPSLQKALRMNNRVLCSVSQSFYNPASDTFLSTYKMYPTSSRSELYSHITTDLLPEDLAKLHQMIVFDYLVNNCDRHSRNFGFVMRDQFDVSFAPLFDHGLALCSSISEVDIEEWGEEAISLERSQPFDRTLRGALEWVDPASLRNINFEYTPDEVAAVYGKYKEAFRPERYQLVSNMLKRRWADVRKIFRQE